jgi:hypothetical protein
MCTTKDSGNCLYMFQSGGKYYLWVQIATEILEIVTSLDLADIITEMGKKGLGTLKTAKVHMVSASG